MYRAADIVHESGKRQLGRSGPPADGVLGLEHEDAVAGLGKGDGRREPVGTRTDDDCIEGASASYDAAPCCCSDSPTTLSPNTILTSRSVLRPLTGSRPASSGVSAPVRSTKRSSRAIRNNRPMIPNGHTIKMMRRSN